VVKAERVAMGCDVLAHGCVLDVATNCVSVHGTYIALEPSLDGKEPTAFKAVVLSSETAFAGWSQVAESN
jgi:hypothetical protein